MSVKRDGLIFREGFIQPSAVGEGPSLRSGLQRRLNPKTIFGKAAL
jgi:hypothetical protein